MHSSQHLEGLRLQVHGGKVTCHNTLSRISEGVSKRQWLPDTINLISKAFLPVLVFMGRGRSLVRVSYVTGTGGCPFHVKVSTIASTGSYPSIYYGVVLYSMILNCKLSPRTKICIAVSSVTKTNSCLPPRVE